MVGTKREQDLAGGYVDASPVNATSLNSIFLPEGFEVAWDVQTPESETIAEDVTDITDDAPTDEFSLEPGRRGTDFADAAAEPHLVGYGEDDPLLETGHVNELDFNSFDNDEFVETEYLQEPPTADDRLRSVHDARRPKRRKSIVWGALVAVMAAATFVVGFGAYQAQRDNRALTSELEDVARQQTALDATKTDLEDEIARFDQSDELVATGALSLTASVADASRELQAGVGEATNSNEVDLTPEQSAAIDAALTAISSAVDETQGTAP